MLVTSIVFVLINNYDIDRVILLLTLVIYKIFDAIADPLYGVMQKHSRLYFAGFSMTLKAVVGFFAFLAVDILTEDIRLAAVCLLAANIVFIAGYDIPRVRSLEIIGQIFKGNLKPGMFLLRVSVFIFSFALLTNLLVNVPRYYVDAYHSDEELGLFGIIIMPATMLNLFVQFVIQPKLVPISERYAAGDYSSVNRTVTKLILISLAFGVIATFLAWFIGCPVLTFIFAENLYQFKVGLTLVVLAGTINTMTMIYSNILSVMRRFKIQLFNYIIAVVSIFIASAVFIESGSVDGAILAFVIGNAIQAALFLISYQVIYRRISCK